MSAEGIPADVIAFITDHIGSVGQLEALLLLHAEAGSEHTAAEVARKLAIDPGWAGGQLENLCVRGIVACRDGPEKQYRFAPTSPDLQRAVDGLAQAYNTHRVSVIGLIFSKPNDQLRSFADAFRIRKEGS